VTSIDAAAGLTEGPFDAFKDLALNPGLGHKQEDLTRYRSSSGLSRTTWSSAEATATGIRSSLSSMEGTTYLRSCVAGGGVGITRGCENRQRWTSRRAGAMWSYRPPPRAPLFTYLGVPLNSVSCRHLETFACCAQGKDRRGLRPADVTSGQVASETIANASPGVANLERGCVRYEGYIMSLGAAPTAPRG
jgi:hypothetical protein